MLTKKITAFGNSAGLVLSQDILGLLGVKVGDEVEIAFVEKTMIIRPLDKKARDQKVRKAMDEVFKEHEGLLKKLAR
jgi:putative addiction module antidote